MYFQIAVSPVEPAKKQQSVVPLEDVAVLKLAPFTPTPKICFENVAVGEVETKKLIIQNPNAFKTHLSITKLLPAQQYLTLSWNEADIEAHEEITLELTWAPKEDGGWREVLSILDNRNVNRNVPIILKSVQKKGKRRTATKKIVKPKPTVVAVPAVKKFRSPKNTKKKRSPLKVSEHSCMPKTYQCDNCHDNIHITTCSPLKKKTRILESNKENSPIMFQQKLENLSPIIYQQKQDNVSFSKLSFSEKLNRMDNSPFFSSPTNVNFKCENVLQTPIRRETYAINRQPVIHNLINSPDTFNDSLDIEKKIDSLELTPDVSIKSSRNSNSSDSFVKKLNMDLTSEISVVSNNKNKSSDHYLVQRLLSDSFPCTTATVTKKTSHFQFVLNENEVLDEDFYPNNCSTDIKIPVNINRNKFSTPKELFKPNNTYELSPGSRKNNSPHNLSGGTYTMSNVSSSSTYALMSPDELHNRIREITDNEKSSNYARISTSSPVLPHTVTNQFPATSNYLNFSGINAKAALSCITEEDQFSDISIRNFSIRSDISNSGMKRKSEQPEMMFTVSPPKRAFIKPKSPKPLKNMNTTWSKKLEKTEKIRRKSISTLKLNLSKSSSKSNISDVSVTSVNITQTSCNIDPFLIAALYNSDTSTVNSDLDPFISSTLYYDESWLEKQMKELKKWLNALLTPPSELAAKAESKKVDVAKLWQDCVKKDLIYAPTKEKVSSKYHTNHKLEILRKSAKNLFHSFEIRTVLSKVTLTIENKQMSIRDDKNLHLDVGLQSHILTYLLCYNPLWLRIGLETIYNEPIPLESNSDVIGLSTFIMLRFFRCTDLMPKNKQSSHIKYLPAYSAAAKKFTLKKFLILIYFLDQAKTKKLISHDPCLFCRDAPVKESKELLLSFSRELLSAVGDITKFLRRLGYEVSHKQSYIDEFDYAVKNLGVDLRDGIRLTKVMEIILLQNDLTNQLRGPAISRLQKIHNVKLALDCLLQAGYTIAGDITAKDIVDGHREKTLSLLWQIIYKFQAPRFTKAASKIQIWWKSLRIVIKRRILERPRQLKINAATKIQQFYRFWKLMQKERAQFLVIKRSVITIQRFTRSMFLMKRDRLQYLLKRQAVIIIQQKYRSRKLMKEQRSQYLMMKYSAILIQRQFRASSTMKKTREQYLKLKEVVTKMQINFRSKQIVKGERNKFLNKRSAAVVIQQHFKATLQMKMDRNIHLRTKNIAVKLQQRFRATILMREVRSTYLEQRRTIIFIQQKYQANILMKKDRKSYLVLRQTIITIQQIFRAKLAMKQARESYLLQRKAAITIQENFRATILMKKVRSIYLKQRRSVIYIQQKYRANIIMKEVRKYYLELRQTVITIQQRFRANLAMKQARESYLLQRKAAITIQENFRATILMKEVRSIYLEQRRSVIYIQQKYRANILMKEVRKSYLELRQTVITIQQRFRANLAMKQARESYLLQRKAAITIQENFRATILMKEVRSIYLEQRRNVIYLQQKYRANFLMKKDRKSYLELRQTVITIQQRFRANLAMKQARESYLLQRKAAITIQENFRATILMKKVRSIYLKQRRSVIYIQQKYRANIIMKEVRKYYLELRQTVITIQQRLRANLAMKQARESYLLQRKAAITIQENFRATILMKVVRSIYLEQRRSVIYIQQKYRANILMKEVRKSYLELRQTVITIQQRFRANLAMKQAREYYLQRKNAVIIIQEKFRAYLAMKNNRENYLILKQTTLFIEQRFTANMAMKKARRNYLQQRNAAVLIQQHFKAYLKMKTCRENYLQKRKGALTIQEKFRAYLAMKNSRENYLILKQTTLFILQRFRANISMKKQRKMYLEKRRYVILLQQKLRATLAMRKDRENYLKTRNAVIILQQHFRANVAMKNEREKYLQIRRTVQFLQERFRANITMKRVREHYLQTKRSAIVIQQRFRAYLAMKTVRENYILQRNVTITIQRRYRANLAMKEERIIFIEQKLAAIKIQRWFKNVLITKKYEKYYLLQKKSVCFIQKRFREYLLMKKQRTKFLEMRKSAVAVQKHFKSYLLMKSCRSEYLSTVKSVTTIQTYFRTYLIMRKCRQTFLQKKEAATKIQRYFRVFLNKCSIQKLQLKTKTAIKIQCWVRMHAAKKQLAILRENSKEIEERKLQRKLNKTAVKIQAVWRGYKTRKAMSKKMALIRQRSVDAANNAVPEFAVGQRNQEAIDLLMYQTSMKEIIRALTILDFTTRLFPNLCIEVCHEITDRLYILLVCTNRSVPDMDATVLCVSVLINLYKYQLTSAAVWKIQYVERLLSLLLHWSDKDSVLFPYVCTLIWLLAQKSEYCEVILAQKNVAKILSKTYQQCERRQKMLSRMRNVPTTTHVKGQKDVLPSLVPDWGILNMNRPRVFKNPVFAVKCLLKKLDISLNI